MAYAFDRRLGNPLHGGAEFGDLARRKERRQRAALLPPRLALRSQEAAPEAWAQNSQLQLVFAIIGCVVEEDAPHRGRIVGGRTQAEDRSSDRQRPLEI